MSGKYDYDCIIGIKSGLDGAIVIYRPDMPVESLKMPSDVTNLCGTLAHLREHYNPLVVIEKLKVRTKDLTTNDGQVDFGNLYRVRTKMRNIEQLRATLQVMNVPFVMVNAMKWQVTLGLRGLNECKAERKRRYKEYAKQLYPDADVTLWNVEALLIMHFGRMAVRGLPVWIEQNLPPKVRMGTIEAPDDIYNNKKD